MMPSLKQAASNPRLTAAVSLQALGLSILPWAYCDGEKKPSKRWAVDEEEKMTANDIRQWWMAHPGDNVGVITGNAAGTGVHSPSDIVGIDLDTPEALAWAAAHLAPTAWRTRTGRVGGGEHWVYRLPALPAGQYIKTCINQHGIQGLDVRGHGGYIAAPPSTHKSGNVYEWISRPASLEDLPFLDLTLFPPVERKAYEEEEEGPPADEPILEAAATWLQAQRPAIEGQGGNAYTFSVCVSLRRGFQLSLDQARQVIKPWNERCLPPWDQRDLDRQLTRALTEGSETPGGKASALAAKAFLERLTQQAAPVLSRPATEESLLDKYNTDDICDDGPATPRVSLDAARDVALSLPADTQTDPGAPFSDHVLQAAATLKREDLPAFIRLRQELKGLKVPLPSWEKAVSKAGSPLRAKEAAAASKINDGDRKRIILTGDDKATCDEILAVLAAAPSIYVSGDKICYLAGDTLTPLSDDLLHNAILQMVSVVKGQTDKTTNDVVMLPTAIPRSIIGLLGNLLPEQRAAFRQVDQVLRFPFCTADAKGNPYLVTKPGYDAVSKTVLVGTSTVALERFASADAALDYLKWLIGDFPFVSDSERDNYLGMLIQLVVRPFIQGCTPLHLIEGNQENVGKSLLAKLPVVLSGQLPAKLIGWPDKGAEEATKSLPEILRRKEAVVGWDNARGSLASTTFEALLTSQVISLRPLGTSVLEDFVIRQLWLMTSNNAETNRDGARRVVRIRVVKTVWGVPCQIKDFESYCINNRGEILSAILHLVKRWIDQGAPIYNDLPTLDSYDHWATVIGSITRANGLHQWLANKQEARDAMTSGDEWSEFITAWWDKHKGEMLTANQVWMLSANTGLLGATMGDGNEKSQQIKLGKALQRQNQTVFTTKYLSVQLLRVPQRANASGYKLVNLRLTAVPDEDTLQKVG